ncbi:MAG: hypothetical protein ACYCXP_04215 [Leptospirillum sp.]
MVDIKSIIQTIEKEVPNLAKSCLTGFVDEASQSLKTALASNQEKIETWFNQLANKELSFEDFKFILKSQIDLTAVEALKEKGLTDIQLQNFRNGVIGLIENAILSAIP